MSCHLKLKKISSFKAVTRKQPFLCKGGNPATGTHIFIFEGEPETVEQIVERLQRIDPTLSLCAGCVTAHRNGTVNEQGNQPDQKEGQVDS